jgi:hypothetical protein
MDPLKPLLEKRVENILSKVNFFKSHEFYDQDVQNPQFN